MHILKLKLSMYIFIPQKGVTEKMNYENMVASNRK